MLSDLVFLALLTTLPQILSPAGGPPGGLLPLPLPLGDWVVRTPIVLADVTITLRGDLVVERGGVLVLRGVRLRMEGERDGDRSIRVEAGGSLVTSYSPLTRARSAITRGEGPGRFAFEVARGGKVQLTSTVLSGAGWNPAHPGLVIDTAPDAEATIADCELFGNHVGLTVRHGDHAIIAATFHDNEDSGLVIERGSARVELAEFSTQRVGVRIAPGSRLHLAGSIVRRSIVGVWATGSDAEVGDSIFLENGSHARFDEAAGGTVHDSVLVAALDAAIVAEGTAAPLLRRNDLVGNRWAVRNENEDFAPVIDARDNYWGAADGPGGDGAGGGDPVSRGVEFSPWCSDSCRRGAGNEDTIGGE